MIRAAAFTALALTLGGCGFPGEPLPPALNRPTRVTDLSAVQRGSNVVVHFTIPKLTTEGLPISKDPDIEIRIGELPAAGWSEAAWEQGGTRIPRSAIRIEGQSATASVDVSHLAGKNVAVGTRIRGPQGRDVGWSIQNLTVVQPLAAPQGLSAKNAPDAVELDWRGTAPQFRIFRRTAEEPQWTQVGTADKPTYMDHAIEFGKTYEYEAQSIEKAGEHYAESEMSESIRFQPEDKFAPAPPAGLTAVPGAKSIEIVWERNVEKDLASYRVYRDGAKIAEGLTTPSFSDRDTSPGKTFRYQVSAVDTAGNESALSPAVEATVR